MRHRGVRVLVTGGRLDPAAAGRLAAAGVEAVYAHGETGRAALIGLAGAHRVSGIIVRQGVIDAGVIAASPGLRVISRHGSGVDKIDIAAATARGIPVLRARGANARSVAEHTLGFMLALVKDLPGLDRSVRQGKWIKAGFAGHDLFELRLGIVGYGQVGSLLAGFCRALGVEVAVYDPKLAPGAALPGGVVAVASAHELAGRSDILTLHCPLTADTRHMVNDALLARMPMGSWLINTARGAIADEAAVLRALDQGRLAGAGLDTFEHEPLAPGSPLRGRADVLLSPHVAGAGRTGMHNMALQSVTNLLAVLDGAPLPPDALVNPQVAGPDGPSPRISGTYEGDPE